jgi:hypothetical protein
VSIWTSDGERFTRRCEHRGGGETCSAPASYQVSRGRKHDAQDSCRRHLAATVDALCGEDRDTVTVKQIRGIT